MRRINGLVTCSIISSGITMAGAEKSIHAKLTELENEIKGLKLMLTELVEKPKGIVALEGTLKGLTVCEEDFEEAKTRSV